MPRRRFRIVSSRRSFGPVERQPNGDVVRPSFRRQRIGGETRKRPEKNPTSGRRVNSICRLRSLERQSQPGAGVGAGRGPVFGQDGEAMPEHVPLRKMVHSNL